MKVAKLLAERDDDIIGSWMYFSNLVHLLSIVESVVAACIPRFLHF